eukprot:scaffold401_cov399-Prasinococcus_capsulatus_cf.AAC.21
MMQPRLRCEQALTRPYQTVHRGGDGRQAEGGQRIRMSLRRLVFAQLPEWRRPRSERVRAFTPRALPPSAGAISASQPAEGREMVRGRARSTEPTAASGKRCAAEKGASS